MDKVSPSFLRSIIDSVGDNLAVMDAHGQILFTNASWNQFASDNGASSGVEFFQRSNYLQICDQAAAAGDQIGSSVAAGLRALIQRRTEQFSFEYPCHSATEQRWFMMTASRLHWDGESCFVIVHKNITRRVQAENSVRELSLTDPLTGLPNRRHFDQFLQREWRLSARDHASMAVLMLDVDHFKRYNDYYGHLAGDDCLQRIAQTVQHFAQRPRDLSARYGGEEFVLVLGATDLALASRIGEKLLAAIAALKIPHADSPVESYVTASLGVAAVMPGSELSESGLVDAADQALYRAKAAGRNRIEMTDSS